MAKSDISKVKGSRSMGKSILSFALVIAFIAGLCCLALFGVNIGSFHIPSVSDQDGIRRGLDLVGGSSIMYEAMPEGDLSADQMKEGMASCVAMLQKRATDNGYTEATVAQVGDNRILVEIPSINDPEEAVQKLGSTALLEFKDADGNVVLTGSDVAKASPQYVQTTQNGPRQYIVELTFSKEAVGKFSEATRNAAAKTDGKNYISISLDGKEISRPSVQSEINSETCQISGNFDQESVTWLSNMISAGKLPFALKEVQLSSVGPTLGEKALETSVFAGMIGVILVMIFMIIIYRLPGIIACIALSGYVAIVTLFLSIFKVNLSLPGIAGIILGIGMAVDANVIIFERIKDELSLGKTIGASVKSGFNRALTAILDSNITTLIAAVVLKFLGTGPIVGFADTLLISVLVSMFTAVVLSRFLLNSLIGMNIKNVKAYGA